VPTTATPPQQANLQHNPPGNGEAIGAATAVASPVVSIADHAPSADRSAIAAPTPGTTLPLIDPLPSSIDLSVQSPSVDLLAQPSATADPASQSVAPSPAAATASSVATADTHPSPANQIAPAVMTLATSTTGTQSLTLRLQPADLGTVQIRIDRPIEAPAHVDISVSRPETLTLLLRDQAQLQHTLDQAGVPAEGRTVSFHLSGEGADGQPRQAATFDHSASNGRAPRLPNPNGTDAAGTPDATDAASIVPIIPQRWQRVGIDITA
jgi:flagellar hook-length control protein FliK